MNFYPFHIGDYAAHTRNLSFMEDLAYRRLIDQYYLDESPLKGEPSLIARRIGMSDFSSDVQYILETFFEKEGEFWVSKRCDGEIAKYHLKADSARNANRIKSEKITALKSELKSEPNQLLTKNQEPLTINQEPITNIKPLIGETKFPPCPYDSLLLLWKKHLPHLTQPRTWEGSRQANMKSRWIQASKPSQYSPDGYKTKEDGIEWWDGFFSYIATDTKLAEGFESKDRSWKPDLQWILLPANFQKIIDGNYNK
ncbi:MAG: YdaU family protein [Verrucomicrobiota bacterium]